MNSLKEDYEGDALANILIPVYLHAPDSPEGDVAIRLLGETNSQLAYHALEEGLTFVEGDLKQLINSNLSKLKLAGIRIDNTIEFCNEDEKLQPSLVFNSLITNAKSKLATLIKTKYEENESFLNSVEVLMNLITSVMLMEGSEADIARKELCDKYQKLAEYREQLNANLPES